MDYRKLIPEPILFNCWKHHLGFIKKELNSLQINDEKDFMDFVKRLNVLGDSLSDLYTGLMSVPEITESILGKTKKLNVVEKNLYKDWINKDDKDYKIIKLSDDSTWTLRYGNEKERYIHIHPARYSMHSIRVKSISLKTALILVLWIKNFGGTIEDLKLINSLRIKYLKASPLKSLSLNGGLGKIIKLFVES